MNHQQEANLIAEFVEEHHNIPLIADRVVVFSSRAMATESLIRLFWPCIAIVDKEMSGNLPRLTATKLEKRETDTEDIIIIVQSDCKPEDIITVIVPRQSDSIVRLIDKWKPRIVVTGMAQFESYTGSPFNHLLGFKNLLDTTREIGCRRCLDVSDWFVPSSFPISDGVLKYLAGTPLPSHVSLVCGLLEKNEVYSGLEVAFVISEDENICDALSNTIERLQGNTALTSQYYFGSLFRKLLPSQPPDVHPPAEEREGEDELVISHTSYTSSCSSLF